ncbi:MAG: ribonuclease III [Eubacteriales bacterium]|nr:ribonuclease III [Eubacteriales bacterium]
MYHDSQPGEQQLEQLQQRLAYRFENPLLLREALTHASRTNEYPDEPCYERLEFLGDAVIELVVTRQLYLQHPAWGEGRMTKARASVVSEPALSDMARQLGIGECMRIGRGTQRLGGREKPSILSDGFEALTGAIFLDGGIAEVDRIILPLLQKALENVGKDGVKGDYKTALQERLQKKGERHIAYRLTGEQGPPHDRVFTVALEVDGALVSHGQGRSKKAAQQAAARAALETIKAKGESL